MADFPINNVGRVVPTPSSSGIQRAAAASTSVPASATTGDVFTPSNALFSGSAHNVDFNAIANSTDAIALAKANGFSDSTLFGLSHF